MTSTSQAPVSPGKRGSVGSYAKSGNASLLIEKAKGALRQSTPNSETLASLDDEVNQSQHNFPNNQEQQPRRSTRHASWFSKVQERSPWNASLGRVYSTVGSNATMREGHTAQLSSFQQSWCSCMCHSAHVGSFEASWCSTKCLSAYLGGVLVLG
jgi:hypothetical protein